MAVIGGARLTNESAYAWAKLAKGIIGTDSVDAQLGDGLPADLVLGLPRATIDAACAAPVLITLAGDLREELPVLFLRLREAVAGSTEPDRADADPDRADRAGHRLAAHPPGRGPAGGARPVRRRCRGHRADDASRGLGDRRRRAGRGAPGRWPARPGGEGVVVVLGRPSYAESGDVVAEAARVLAGALPKATFLPALRRGNVFGALDMGLAPGLLPGRVGLESGREWFTAAWGAVPEATGLDTAAILSSMAGEAAGAPGSPRSILLGADPLSDFPDRARWPARRCRPATSSWP